DVSKRKFDFQLSRVVIATVVDQLLTLADNSNADIEVKLAAFAGLKYVLTKSAVAGDDMDAKFFELQNWRINRFLERPYSVQPDSKKLTVPPGSPIGSTP
ncbi:MAG: hypothetical protein ACPHO8_18825, partial [Mariniblastus sp.]